MLSRSPREERRGESHAKGVNENSVDEHRKGKRSLAGGGQWNHDVAHDEIHDEAICHAERDGMACQHRRAAAGEEIHDDDHERNEEMEHAPEHRRREPALKRLAPEQTRSDGLKDPDGLDAAEPEEDEGIENVEDADSEGAEGEGLAGSHGCP